MLTTAALNAVENKIPGVGDLVKKIDYDTKVSDFETKYLATSDYNKFTGKLPEVKIKEKGFVDKSNISNPVKNFDSNTKLATLATKAELKTERDKIVKLKAFDSSYFSDKSHFKDDGSQNYLFFQPVYRYFKNVANSERVLAWKSKGLPDESVKPRATSDNSLPPAIVFDNIAKL